jgi:hypothetical protein
VLKRLPLSHGARRHAAAPDREASLAPLDEQVETLLRLFSQEPSSSPATL